MRGGVHTTLVVFTALLSVATCQLCRPNIHRAPCGQPDASQQDCEAAGCCFNPPGSGVIAPQCYYPTNAEMSSYFASSLQIFGLDSVVNGTLANLMGTSGETCIWGWPVLTPAPRPTDNWGIGWTKLHEIEVMEIETADITEGYDLIFYGDSITEIWRGTSCGSPFKVTNGDIDNTTYVSYDMRAVTYERFAHKYRTGAMGIAGDQIGHLWWRLLHGELPAKPPKVAVVLIGTNDLYAMANCLAGDDELTANAVGNITTRFQEMLGVMRAAMPRTHIVIQGLYPRGADFDANKYVWPNNYTYALSLLNSHYERVTEADPLMHYIYCGAHFVTPTGDGIEKRYLADGLHPVAAGLEVIATCLEPLLAKLIPPAVNKASGCGINATASLPPDVLQ